MRHKLIKATIIILFVLDVLFTIASSYFTKALNGGEITSQRYTEFMALGLLIILVIGCFQLFDPKDYSEVEMTSDTPKNIYGLYALFAFVLIMTSVYIFAFVTR